MVLGSVKILNACAPASTDEVARPFVKWVGGKRQLLPSLLPIFAVTQANAYHEPFVGGGAAFFALHALGRTPHARLSDVNRELIESYTALRDCVDEVIEALKRHETLSTKEYFYRVRAERPRSPVGRAARLIYLNKTCFNGLYRVNSSGEFNVSWGLNKNATICDEPNLRAVSAALSDATIDVASFQSVLDHARSGDLVYFDPPYIPVASASFTEYSAGGFGAREQGALLSLVRELDARGVNIVLSNSDTAEVRRLYSAFRVEQVLARRNVNTRADKRGPVPELIVRNF